jgi:hypothetical protein
MYTEIKKLASMIRIANQRELDNAAAKLKKNDSNVLAWQLYNKLWSRSGAYPYYLDNFIGGDVLDIKSPFLDLFNHGVPHILWMSGLRLNNLEELDLSNNELVSLRGIGGLIAPNLQSILVANNMLVSLRDLQNLKADNLEHLILSSNNLTHVDELLELDADNLKTLDLTKNPIINKSVVYDSLQLKFPDAEILI